MPQPILKRILFFPLTKIIIGFVVCTAAVVVVQIGCDYLFGKTAIHKHIREVLTGIMLAVASILSYIWLFRWYEKRQITELSINNFWRNATLGILTGLLLQSLVILVIYIYGGYSVISVNPLVSVLPAFAVAITSAITEEILFRGILFRITEEKLGSVYALLISSLFFGLIE